MSKKRILIAGCGDVGSRTAILLAQQGHTVYGLRRTINQLPQGIQGIEADLNDIDTLKNLPDVDIVIYSAAATDHGEAGYRKAYIDGVNNIRAGLRKAPELFLFTSSTGVYGQNQHETVDENSACEAQAFNGKVMREAELNVLSRPDACVVRFSGIYGPGRERMIRMVKEGKTAPSEPIMYSNRIHSDDCAGVLTFLTEQHLQGTDLEDVYLASDLEPAPIHDVMNWLAKQLDVDVRPSDRVSRSSKKCDSSRLQKLGYQFQYPSFRDGYKALLKRDQ